MSVLSSSSLSLLVFGGDSGLEPNFGSRRVDLEEMLRRVKGAARRDVWDGFSCALEEVLRPRVEAGWNWGSVDNEEVILPFLHPLCSPFSSFLARRYNETNESAKTRITRKICI